MSKTIDEFDRRITAQRAAAQAQRNAFLNQLLGADPLARLAPPPLQDFDDALSEHAAQLAKGARHMMGDVLDDTASLTSRALAINALTKMIQANIAIAKTVSPTVPPKTIQGVRRARDTQD